MKFQRPLLAAFLLSLALATSTALAADGKEPVTRTKSLMQRIQEGGWVMYPIGLCSVLTLYLIGDGIIRVTSPGKNLPAIQVETVRGFFRAGKYVDAYNYCAANPSAFTNVTRVALTSLSEGKAGVEESVVAELAKENSRMQTFISYLSVIGVCTPMIGLLGTVTGMITAFDVLGSQGIGDPSSLSAAIGEVLTATASGLFIAIPAFTGFYYLRNRAAKVLHDVQDSLAGLFRKMPYDDFAGVHIGDEELVAARPEWVVAEEQPAT